MKIKLRNNHFDLLPQKALYWHEKQTLLIADLHLGKITHFRKEGIALPSSAIQTNFDRLDEILSATQAKRMLFLGDLFHHHHNAEWDRFIDWRNRHPEIEMVVILGNHDRLPAHHFTDNNIQFFSDYLQEDEFIFTHFPSDEPVSDYFVFAGHIHPVFTTHGKGRQRISLPCLVVDPHQAVLPSFGVFTGGYRVTSEENRSIYISTETAVFKAEG